MASLLDVAGKAHYVEVNEVKVEVTGISGAGLASLMSRFPEVNKLFNGLELSRDELGKMGPVALAAFIAAGTGHEGDEAHETAAAKLPLGSQLEFVDAILTQTFPRGVGPFVEKLGELGIIVRRAREEVSAPGSPQQSSSLSQQDTAEEKVVPPTPGATPPEE